MHLVAKMQTRKSTLACSTVKLGGVFSSRVKRPQSTNRHFKAGISNARKKESEIKTHVLAHSAKIMTWMWRGIIK